MHKLKQLAAAAIAGLCLTLCVASTLAIGVDLAQAQAIVSGAPDRLNAGNVFAQFEPAIVEVVLGIIAIVVVYAARQFKKWTGIDIEAKVRSIEADHRDGLHSAVVTALGKAIATFGLDKLEFTPTSPVGQFIVRLVKQSVPEAVNVLNATDQWILNAAEAKLMTGEVDPAWAPQAKPSP